MRNIEYKHFILKYFSLTLFAGTLFISACQQQQVAESFNFYGGTTRANNFDRLGTFTSTMIMVDKPKGSSPNKPKSPNDRLGAICAPLPISQFACYIATIDGYVVKFSNGKAEWSARLDSSLNSSTAKTTTVAAALPAADSKENLYVQANNGMLYAFAPDGKRRWAVQTFTPSPQMLYSDVLVVHDGILTAASSGEAIKVDFEGKIQWKHALRLAPTKTFAADEHGNIVFAITHDTFAATDSVVMLTASGERRWTTAIEQTRLFKSPVLCGNMILCAGIKDAQGKRTDMLFALDTTGKMLWSKELTITPQGIAASGTDSLIVVGGYKVGVGSPLTLILGFDTKGKERWRMGYELSIVGAPMVSAENLVFVGTKGDAIGVYYMKKDGTYQNVVSISDYQPLHLLPSVDYTANLVFGTSEELGVIRVGTTPVQRLLPY